MKIEHGDILVFQNGFIGCVTMARKLAMVDPRGRVTSVSRFPSLDDYMAKHALKRHERPLKKGDIGYVHDQYNCTVLWKAKPQFTEVVRFVEEALAA